MAETGTGSGRSPTSAGPSGHRPNIISRNRGEGVVTVTPIAELEELLPCPFCGGESKLEDATRITGLWRLFHRCTVLPGTFGVVMGETAGDCVRKWNTRAESSTLSTLSARVEELEDALEELLNTNELDWERLIAAKDRARSLISGEPS